MSNISISEGNLAAVQDRRAHPRQSLHTLAYLDLKPDNGGIVLDLSQDGLGFRAVGPLDRCGEIHLAIQLPFSRDRIEAEAQIVWLNETKRSGGLRFTEISEAGRAAIEQWVISQASCTPSRDKLPPPSKSVRELRPPRPPAMEVPWGSFEAGQSLNSQPGPQRIRQEEHLDEEKYLETPIPAESDPIDRVDEQSGRDLSARITRSLSDASKPPAELSIDAVDGGVQADRPAIPGESSTSKNWEPIVPHDLVTRPVRSRAAMRWQHLASLIKGVDASSRTSAARTAAALIAGVILFVLLFLVVRLRFGNTETVSGTSRPLTTVGAPVAELETSSAVLNENSRHRLHTAERDKEQQSRPLSEPPPAPNDQRLAAPISDAPLFDTSEPLETPDSPRLDVLPPASRNAPAPQPAPTDAPTVTDPPRIVDGRVLKPSDRFNPCHLTYRMEPEYPDEAKRQHLEGVVKLHQTIGPDGSVLSVKAISGPPLLIKPASDAARYWRYFPALLNGEPVETEKDIEIEFRLSN
jgi:TonB family protein